MDILYYGFCGAIANFVVWISLFFPLLDNRKGIKNTIMHALFDTAVVIKGCLPVITMLDVSDIYIFI